MKSIEFTLKNSIRGIRRHIPDRHLGIACALSGMLVFTMLLTPSENASAKKNVLPVTLSLPDTSQQQVSYASMASMSNSSDTLLESKSDITPEEMANLAHNKLIDKKTPIIDNPQNASLSKSKPDNVQLKAIGHAFLANELDALISSSIIGETPTAQVNPTDETATVTELAAVSETSSNPEAPSELADLWQSHKVKKGDNLSLIFKRAGLSGKDIARVMSGNENAKQLKRIFPGQVFDFKIKDGDLQAIRFDKDRLHRIEYHKIENGFREQENITEPEIKLTYRSATITNSLFLDGVRAGISDNIIMQLAGIFAWDIDFALDIRKNDTLHVLFEEKYVDGEKIGTGKILAAQFINKKKPFSAVRFTDSQGYSKYYTPEGRSMRKAFLRSPVDFARISSHFNLKRKHPVLNRIRAHKGTDYAARTGTPIRSAGDGKIAFIGTKGGYGRTVIVQHNRTYKTLYAHMSKYHSSVKSGSRVKQGQIIGYVGSSGLATGPHLHYEFYVNNSVRNPVTVKLPTALPVPESELALFKTQTQPLMLSLNKHLTGGTQHAMRDGDDNNKNANTN